MAGSSSSRDVLIERFFEVLLQGDRVASRRIIAECVRDGASAQDVLINLIWPTHELVERLHREDQMTIVAYQLATRLMRVLVDQLASGLQQQRRNGQRIFAACGPSQGEELGGQMACDLLEAAGFEVTFCGGGIPSDEILEQVQSRQPDFLVMFSSAASDLPGIRVLLDQLREVNAIPHTKIALGGGVFNRAEGLAEEMGCDLVAMDPLEMVELLTDPAAVEVATRPVAKVAVAGTAVKKAGKSTSTNGSARKAA